MKEHYKKENLEKVIKESFSYAEALRKIGLADVGSNFATIKKYILQYNLDTSHFTGQLWSKGKTAAQDPRLSVLPMEKIFSNEIGIKTYNLKEKLFNLGYKERKCEICGCEEEWQGKPLTLEVHHMDGNHYNNSLGNLQILCPNCHSQTNNFRNRKKIKVEKPQYEKIEKTKHICLHCGKEFYGKSNRKYCSEECSRLGHLKNIITEKDLKELINKYNSIHKLSNETKLSRPTIRKYLIKYGLYNDFKKKQNC